MKQTLHKPGVTRMGSLRGRTWGAAAPSAVHDSTGVSDEITDPAAFAPNCPKRDSSKVSKLIQTRKSRLNDGLLGGPSRFRC